MTLRPEPMVRVLLVVPTSRSRSLVEALHRLHVCHLIPHSPTADLPLGRPLPESSRASERLVRLRSTLRSLGLEGTPPSSKIPIREVERNLDERILQAEQDALSALESRSRLERLLHTLEEEKERLLPLLGLPLRLEDFRGYESLGVRVGRVETSPKEDLERSVREALLFESGGVVALFYPKSEAPVVEEILFRHSFREIPVPEGVGEISGRIGEIEREIEEVRRKLPQAHEKVREVRERWKDFLLAAEEHLSILAEKAEAPLRFGSTQGTTLVEAWVPLESLGKVRREVERATEGRVHFEILEEDSRPPPTKMRNPRAFKPFEFFTELFSIPRPFEVDPTPLLAVAFPFFYGMMIGDAGYGLLMLLLGLALVRVFPKWGGGGRELGVAFAVAGGVALVLGALVFQDALGIPFGASPEALEHLEKEGLPLTCSSLKEALKETTWSCLLGGSLVESHPLVEKLVEVGDLLLFSIVLAFLHLSLAFLLGISNEIHHSKVHALSKASWLLVLISFFLLVLSQSRPLSPRVGEPLGGLAERVGLFSPMVLGGVFLLGVVGLLFTEGGVATVEIPSLLANLLSYTRLAGVAVAKAAMAVAFNGLTLVSWTLGPSGALLFGLGLLLFVIAQLLVFVLGLLSSGIQAIRLNYVEFFTKFFQGGGTKFSPFGRIREYTTET